MLSVIRPAVVSVVLFTGVLGIAYPLAITGVAQAAFPSQANGSLITDAKGKVVGSAFVGQNFAKPQYLHPRPSAAGSSGYDASASSGSNYGPLNADLAKRVAESAAALRAEGAKAIPADAVTTSGSGLDPDISPAFAELQVQRIADARGVTPAQVREAIAGATSDRTFGILGQARVNVLKANLALDARWPVRQLPAS
ncbi:potassium-transporting ATPase subunit KdpC [Caulobacter mirabilis]|uniref:Potassium-transporting ATPase KdpC subunit n=1 Tax=Caulobacter mirabilis TaxID=69666 RepID=A0A2D2AXS2_9CAUL|nr:potassium-transporting ATPase subunit KdpC [Caulobacter mirabilis]ATQ42808.1 potassium-transporting ATPase subunit C [Caulobacter mirabilis]